MLSELLNIVSTGRFEDLGCLDLASATWDRGDLIVVFSLAYEGAADDKKDYWSVTCKSVIEYVISRASDCGLNHWKEDHPALRQYSEPFESLFFGATARNPEAMLGKLWAAHQSATDGWIDFDRYLNEALSIGNLARTDMGLLANGPSFVIEAYAAVLEIEEMGPRRIASQAGTYVPDAEMIHFGHSFVVAASFSARQHEV